MFTPFPGGPPHPEPAEAHWTRRNHRRHTSNMPTESTPQFRPNYTRGDLVKWWEARRLRCNRTGNSSRERPLHAVQIRAALLNAKQFAQFCLFVLYALAASYPLASLSTRQGEAASRARRPRSIATWRPSCTDTARDAMARGS